jgi:hypothetical protein
MEPNPHEVWEKGSHAFLAMANYNVACSADACYELMCADRGERVDFDKVWPIPSKNRDWISLYKNRQQVMVKNLVAFQGLSLEDATRFYKHLRFNQPMSPLEASAYVKKLIDPTLAGFNVHAIANWPEARFFIRVSFACWLEYGQTATYLMRKARQGDLKSIEAILRLDKGALEDKRIRDYIYNARNTNSTQFDDIVKAIHKPIVKSVALKRVKMSLAGYISAQSRSLDMPLEEPAIRKIFDDVAAVKGLGRIDTDIPDSPESFSQAILRHRSYWNFLFQPRQKLRRGLSG